MALRTAASPAHEVARRNRRSDFGRTLRERDGGVGVAEKTGPKRAWRVEDVREGAGRAPKPCSHCEHNGYRWFRAGRPRAPHPPTVGPAPSPSHGTGNCQQQKSLPPPKTVPTPTLNPPGVAAPTTPTPQPQPDNPTITPSTRSCFVSAERSSPRSWRTFPRRWCPPPHKKRPSPNQPSTRKEGRRQGPGDRRAPWTDPRCVLRARRYVYLCRS